MPQVENFIIRPNKFEGFEDLARGMERKEDRDYLRMQRGQKKRDDLMDNLLTYANPKDYFTGTPQDPIITQEIMSVLKDGAKFITDNPELTTDMLYTYVAPRVGKVSAASQNLKQIEAQRKQSEELLKPHKGIDMDVYNREFKKNAFYNPDGTLKDPSTVDPQQDYADYTLKNSDVFNNTGFDQFAKESKMWTDKGKVKDIGSRGQYKMFNTELSAPNFLISEKDKEGTHTGFVPKFEVATENGKPLMHKFNNPDGTVTEAPVRLLDKTIMNDLPPDAKAFILQETRKYARENGVPLSSTQAENFGRALAYDNLNTPTKKWGTVKVIEETKAPQIKVYNNSGSGKGSDDAKFNDIHERIKNKGLKRFADYRKGDYFSNALEGNELDADELEVVMKATQDKNVTPENIKVIVEDDGKIGVYKKDDGTRLVYLNQTGANLGKQSGKKGKDISIDKGNKNYDPLKLKDIKSSSKPKADPLGIL